MSGAVDEKCFWFSCLDIYMSFSALDSALTLLGVSTRWCLFSSIFPAVNSTVGSWPIIFIIIRCYETSINITSERFHWTFNLFIFRGCRSTIHLMPPASWGTMCSLAPFSKANRALHFTLWSWGHPRLVQRLDGLLWYLLESLEVLTSLQLSHLDYKYYLDLFF